MSNTKPNNQETVSEVTGNAVFSALSEARKTRIESQLEKAKVEYKRLYEEAERDFFKFLFAANAGAAVAFLAFLDKSTEGAQNPAAIWPLSFFSFGVVLVGVALMINSYGLRRITLCHINDAAAFMRDEISLLELHRKTKPKLFWIYVIDTLCVLSFIGFIVGCILAYHVLQSQPQ